MDKDFKSIPTTSLQKETEEVPQCLHKMKSSNEQLLLVAHNGHTFDLNRFLNFTQKANSSEYSEKAKVLFGDSLLTFRKVFKDKCRSLKLVNTHTNLSFQTTLPRLMMR